jgi:mannosyltransferase
MLNDVPRTVPPLAVRLAAALGLFGALVSMLGSWMPSLWGDEAASVMSARRPLGSLFLMLAHVDAVHGLFYVALHFWIRVVGTTSFAERLPSAIAIGGTVAEVTWLASRFGSWRFAACAGVVAAVIPQLTFAGEEVRAYAFDALLATAIAVIVVELERRPDATRRWWIAYGVVLCVGIYTFLYLGLMIGVVGIVLWLTPVLREQWRPWLKASAIAVAGALPVIVFAVIERNQIAFLGTRVITLHEVGVSMWFGHVSFAVVAWALIAVAVVGWLRDLRRTRPEAGDAPRFELFAVVWLVLPMGLVIAATPLMAGFTARYATMSAPAAALLMAYGIRRLVRWAGNARRSRRQHWVGVAATAVVVVLAVPIWVSQRGPFAMNHSDWNQIGSAISAAAKPGDGIVFDHSAKPSKRPELAMDTDPRAFRNVTNLVLHLPYAQNTLWTDTVYTVNRAAAIGRFDGVHRVWMVEYATGARADAWGIHGLAELGFHRTRTLREHSSVIYLYER